MRAAARSAAFAPLAPVLLVQARRTSRRMPRLDPATGAHHGIAVGQGPLFRLIVIGESTAVGVGARTHAEALPGQLAEALRERTARTVAWSVAGRNGATVRKVITDVVPVSAVTEPDLVVVAIGVNDLIRRRPLPQFAADLTELIGTLRARYPGARVLVAGMPPVRRFPAIPQPLRMVLGARAMAMDQIMRQVAGPAGATHVPMDEQVARDRRLFAADGFHPSAAGYRAWAGDLARAA